MRRGKVRGGGEKEGHKGGKGRMEGQKANQNEGGGKGRNTRLGIRGTESKHTTEVKVKEYKVASGEDFLNVREYADNNNNSECEWDELTH